jgi:LPS sulfotransferase NodH
MEVKNKKRLKSLIKNFSNFHSPTTLPDFFIFTMPRSGSTWLMELLVTQPEFKYCSELFNIRNPEVCKQLKIDSWDSLYNKTNSELVENYVARIHSGKLGIFNPNPFGKYYRLSTSRIVFKIIHFGEDRINWFRDTFNGKVVFLTRHPMAVGISRKILPRLKTFVYSDYIEQFTQEQKKLAEQIFQTGDHLEKAMLSWCFQNYPAIRDREDNWAFITYEQLVTEPQLVIQYLTDKLNLVKTDIISQNLARRSMVKKLSDDTTAEIFEKGERDKLITKWRKKVDVDTEKKLFEIVRAFDIDIYQEGNYFPTEKYLIKSL